MTRKLSGLVFGALILSLLLSACIIESDPFAGGAINTEGYHNYTGTVFGTAQGFKSTIRVDLTLVDGFITEADIYSVSGSETPGFASALTLAPSIMVHRNSVELDTLAGASITTRGIVQTEILGTPMTIRPPSFHNTSICLEAN